jgi:hypothetical protein
VHPIVETRTRWRAFLVVAILETGALLAAAVPAHAETAAASSATAVGLVSTGLLPLPPTPTITASQPPDSGEMRQALVDLPVPPLALTGTSTVVTEASRESRIPTPAFPDLKPNALRRHVPVSETNARAFARTEGLALVSTAPQALPLDLLVTTLVTATAVESVAVARCVDGQALFDTDFNVSGLKVLGQDLGLDALLLPVLTGLNMPGAISVIPGEAGRLPDGSGVFINGLHISIPVLNVDIVIARSEARMPAQCSPSAPADVASESEQPALATLQTDAPQLDVAQVGAPQLAVSGGSLPLAIPVGMILSGLALRRCCRRGQPQRTVPG